MYRSINYPRDCTTNSRSALFLSVYFARRRSGTTWNYRGTRKQSAAETAAHQLLGWHMSGWHTVLAGWMGGMGACQFVRSPGAGREIRSAVKT
jgi:hypothetical protein